MGATTFGHVIDVEPEVIETTVESSDTVEKKDNSKFKKIVAIVFGVIIICCLVGITTIIL